MSTRSTRKPRHQTDPAPLRAAVYVRISRDPSGERAGVERQRTECMELVARDGLTLVPDSATGSDVHEDNDVSAYSGKERPAFDRVLALAESGAVDIIVVWAVDRLYRRVADLGRVVEACKPHAVQVRAAVSGRIDLGTADGRLHAGMLAQVAQHESEHKAERLVAQARQRAEQGRAVSSIRPFGWAWVDPCPGGEACRHVTASRPDPCAPGSGMRPRAGSRDGLRPHPTEGSALAEAYRRIAAGSTLRSVAAWLATRHPTGTRGAPMEPTALRGALLAPRNAGLVAHRGQIVAEAADRARIVDRDLWERVGVILNDPSRRTSPGRPAGTPLAKTLRCGKCGGTMSATMKHDRGGKVPVYVCSRHHHLTRRRTLLDGPILDLVGEVLGVLADRGDLTAAGATDTSGPIRDQIAGLEGRRDALAGLVTSGALDPADYATAANRIRAELDQLVEALNRAVGRPALASLGTDVAGSWRVLRQRAEDGDADGLRSVLAELVHHITVMVPEHAGHPRPDDVQIVWADWLPGNPPDHPTIDSGAPALSRDARRAEAVRLHADGLNVSQIAARVGSDRSTVRDDLEAAGVRPVRRRR